MPMHILVSTSTQQTYILHTNILAAAFEAYNTIRRELKTAACIILENPTGFGFHQTPEPKNANSEPTCDETETVKT
jgi:hypothetical protein